MLFRSEPNSRTERVAVATGAAGMRSHESPRAISLTVPPNTQWKYSNLGYQLLGELVSRVSGMTYARYIRSRILTPLKMASTALDPVPQRLRTRKAVGYEPRFLSDELAEQLVTEVRVLPLRVRRHCERDVRGAGEVVDGLALVEDEGEVGVRRLALEARLVREEPAGRQPFDGPERAPRARELGEAAHEGIGRASCRERVLTDV